MRAGGLLLVLADPPPAFEEEFNAWYDDEHLPERAALPGFLSARRFVSLGDGPRYAALYDLDTPEALATPEYAACSGANFSPWTRRAMARAFPLRLTGALVGAGAPTGPLARLLILTFEGAHEAEPVRAGLAAGFAGHPGHLQTRVLRGLEPEPRLIALVEFAGNDMPRLDLAALGAAGKAVTLAASYRPYRR